MYESNRDYGDENDYNFGDEDEFYLDPDYWNDYEDEDADEDDEIGGALVPDDYDPEGPSFGAAATIDRELILV